MITSYKQKIVLSGDIIEVYNYREEVFEGFKQENEVGRGKDASDEDKLLNREKVLLRARKDIRRLVNTNLTDGSKFITLTFADNVQDVQTANYEFKKFRQRLEFYLKLKLKYVCVIEFQKRGAIHYHVIMFNVPYIRKTILADLWGQGFVKINRIDNVDNVGAYVCKYLSKNSVGEKRLWGKKCYFSSRGLDKPVEIKNKKKIENLLNSLSAKDCVFENTFENNYNAIVYQQYNLRKDKIKGQKKDKKQKIV